MTYYCPCSCGKILYFIFVSFPCCIEYGTEEWYFSRNCIEVIKSSFVTKTKSSISDVNRRLVHIAAISGNNCIISSVMCPFTLYPVLHEKHSKDHKDLGRNYLWSEEACPGTPQTYLWSEEVCPGPPPGTSSPGSHPGADWRESPSPPNSQPAAEKTIIKKIIISHKISFMVSTDWLWSCLWYHEKRQDQTEGIAYLQANGGELYRLTCGVVRRSGGRRGTSPRRHAAFTVSLDHELHIFGEPTWEI